jgi:hypothetical protein
MRRVPLHGLTMRSLNEPRIVVNTEKVVALSRKQDSHADLLSAELAAFTTLGADAIPQTTMVWFLHENGELRISLNTARLKARLRTIHRCSPPVGRRVGWR